MHVYIYIYIYIYIYNIIYGFVRSIACCKSSTWDTRCTSTLHANTAWLCVGTCVLLPYSLCRYIHMLTDSHYWEPGPNSDWNLRNTCMCMQLCVDICSKSDLVRLVCAHSTAQASCSEPQHCSQSPPHLRSAFSVHVRVSVYMYTFVFGFPIWAHAAGMHISVHVCAHACSLAGLHALSKCKHVCILHAQTCVSLHCQAHLMRYSLYYAWWMWYSFMYECTYVLAYARIYTHTYV